MPNRHELRNRTRAELVFELAYQRAEGVHTMGPGRCGHAARGSGFCAGCIEAELRRRDHFAGADNTLGGGDG